MLLCFEDKASSAALALLCLEERERKKKKERKRKKEEKKNPALLGEKGHDDHLSREGLFGKHSISNKGFDDQHSQKALLISRGRKACGNFW